MPLTGSPLSNTLFKESRRMKPLGPYRMCAFGSSAAVNFVLDPGNQKSDDRFAGTFSDGKPVPSPAAAEISTASGKVKPPSPRWYGWRWYCEPNVGIVT